MAKLRSRRTLTVSVLAALVVAVGIGVAAIDRANSNADIEEWTKTNAKIVESVVQDVIDGTFNDLDAVAALVLEADPTPESFNRFVRQIDGTVNAMGVGYVSIVPAELLEEHSANNPPFLYDEYADAGLVTAGGLEESQKVGRETFYPIELFTFGDLVAPILPEQVPTEQLGLGIEAGYVEPWRTEIQRAVKFDGRTLSSFISLDAGPYSFERAFFASVPVKPTDGRLPGLVVALMFEPLLLDNLDNRSLDGVKWEVIPVGGSATRIESDNYTVFPLDVPGTPWSLAIAPTDETLADVSGLPFWISGLLASALTALAFTIMWLLLERRAERKQTDRLRATADEKDRFLATVSHELRTPLTVVSGVANELHDRPADFSAEENRDLLGMIVEQTDELAAIVEDLLIAARSDIGKIKITKQPVELCVEAVRAMDTAGTNASTHGTPGVAIADDQRVRQILRNLLTNARRYGGPNIKVEYTNGPDWVAVTVADDGVGIPAAQRDSVFEAYESAHQDDRPVKSVGLGLYISRELANAMGGDLEYHRNQGWSRFTLRLPAGQLPSVKIERPEVATTAPG